MSLDVYLTTDRVARREPEIFIRRAGATVAITREEWDALYPGREPFVLDSEETDDVYQANITHNLGGMAQAAGIYKPLWRPEEIGITQAAQLIEPLRAGLEKLRADPDTFRAHNPANGWGNYEALVSFVEKYLAACIEYPDADVTVSR